MRVEGGIFCAVVPITANFLASGGRFVRPVVRNVRIILSLRVVIPGHPNRIYTQRQADAGKPGERGITRLGGH